jgi:hypothetical protein
MARSNFIIIKKKSKSTDKYQVIKELINPSTTSIKAATDTGG